jgi:hypothetical protein
MQGVGHKEGAMGSKKGALDYWWLPWGNVDSLLRHLHVAAY